MYKKPQLLHQLQNIPNNKQIQQFYQKFKQDDQLDIVEQNFTVANSQIQAYMIFVLCYRGPKIADQIQEIFNKMQTPLPKTEETIKKLRNILDRFYWEQSKTNSTKTFQRNMKSFSDNYQFFSRQIITKLNQSSVIPLYKQCCSQSPYLYAARIRQFKGQKIDRKNRRKFQQDQNNRIPGNNYVIIDHCRPDYIIVGAFRTSDDYPTDHQGLSQKKIIQQRKQAPKLFQNNKEDKQSLENHYYAKSRVQTKQVQQVESKCPFCQLI